MNNAKQERPGIKRHSKVSRAGLAIPTCSSTFVKRHRENRTGFLSCIAASTVLTLIVARTASAADRSWTGSKSQQWQDPANWEYEAMPGPQHVAKFQGGENRAIDLGKDTTSAGITFGTGAGDGMIIKGHTLTLIDGGVISKPAFKEPSNQTIESAVKLLGSATFTNDNAWVHMADQLIIAGPISGKGAITITGGGNGGVVFRGNNESFTGPIMLKSGMLLVGDAKALGDASAGTEMTGGQLWFDGNANTREPFTIAGDLTWESLGDSQQTGTIALKKGAKWIVGNGGGNALVLSGRISGDGEITLKAGRTTLSGSESNTFTGTITNAAASDNLPTNELRFAKTSGAKAIAGPLVLRNKGVASWQQDDQLDDAAPITLAGGTLKLNGHHDKVGPLTLAGVAGIDLGGGKSAIQFSAGTGTKWDAHGQLLIKNWPGPESHSVEFGNADHTLSDAQVAQIGFIDPAGKPAGLYRATMLKTGEVIPAAMTVAAVNPPFDVSAAARRAREASYGVHGLETLTKKGTPLKKGTRISFFGDSITWLNGYITTMGAALEKGEGTAGLQVRLINHGINGGGVLQVRDGATEAAFDGGTNSAAQAPFAKVIAADHADIAVVFIGINDVWWRKTAPADFEKALTDIAAQAKANGTKLVLATLTVREELPDGSNPDDKKIEQFAEMTRKVAKASDATLVDLRRAYVDFLRNENADLQLDGSLTYRKTGVLTYDGVHPNARGVELLAEQIANGIVRCVAGS